MEQLLTDNKQATSIEQHSPISPLTEALGRMFPSQQDETRLSRARGIMGESVKELADEDLEIYLTEFQYLIDSYLDEYERQVFDGSTLKQVLGQG